MYGDEEQRYIKQQRLVVGRENESVVGIRRPTRETNIQYRADALLSAAEVS